MLFFVIGVPGRFTEHCEDLTTGLVQQAFGSAGMARADTLDEIARNLLYSGASRRIVASRHPGGRVRRALAEAGRPIVVVLDDPRAALANLVIRREIGIRTAIQWVASSCAST